MLKKQREFIISKNMSLMEEVPFMMSCGPETTLKESESSKILRRYTAESGRLYKLLELHKIKYDSVDTKQSKMEGMLDG